MQRTTIASCPLALIFAISGWALPRSGHRAQPETPETLNNRGLAPPPTAASHGGSR